MSKRPPSHRVGAERGFTLIELMIAVVVVGILAAVAFPSFMDSIRKSRRSEAYTALSKVQQMQERWRGNNQTYSGNLSAAWPTGLGIDATTPSGYYTVAVSGNTEKAYEAVATAVGGTSQAKDGDCAKLGVKMDSGMLTYAGTTTSGSLTYANTHKCWSR